MKKSYSDLLKDPRWQRKKTEILQRDHFTCKLCGDYETTLHVHHKEYISGNDPWDYPNSYLVTVCEHCHREISESDIKELPFESIKIYKSNNWQGGGRIMFISHDNICSMTIYNQNGEYVCGFDFDIDIPFIIKIFKRTYSNGKKIH